MYLGIMFKSKIRASTLCEILQLRQIYGCAKIDTLSRTPGAWKLVRAKIDTFKVDCSRFLIRKIF